MRGLLGHVRRRKKQPLTEAQKRRTVERLMREYPDLWPLAYRLGHMDVMEMPAAAFDHIMDQIRHRQTR